MGGNGVLPPAGLPPRIPETAAWWAEDKLDAFRPPGCLVVQSSGSILGSDAGFERYSQDEGDSVDNDSPHRGDQSNPQSAEQH